MGGDKPERGEPGYEDPSAFNHVCDEDKKYTVVLTSDQVDWMLSEIPEYLNISNELEWDGNDEEFNNQVKDEQKFYKDFIKSIEDQTKE